MFPIRDHNPSTQTPFVTWALIAANVAVFLLSLSLYGDEIALNRFYTNYAMIPDRILEGSGLATVLTSMFLHAGILHIAGNMLFLWVFGDNLEERMGHLGFLAFYLACGIAAAGAQILADPASDIPMVGASGAIAGVMGGYLLLFPRARVDVLFVIVILIRVIPIPAWVVLGFWFASQLVYGAVVDGSEGGVAYWAHAGGFIAGALFALPLWRRLGGRDFWNRTAGHPPNPAAQYPLSQSRIPPVRRK